MEQPSSRLERGISVVVPVYNSEATLRDLILRLEQVMPGVSGGPGMFEVILVNDGSRDNSWAVVRELARQYPFVRGINLLRNSGQHNALLCGVRAARREFIVTIDDDLQNPPEEIPKMMALLEGGADVVYGRPAVEQHGLLRDLASVITKMVLQNAMGTENARHISAFRAFRTKLRAAFSQYRSSYVSLDVLLTWGTKKFASVVVRHEPRAAGVSNYTVGKLVTHAFNMMTGFSTAPLRIATMTGFAFTLFGMGVLVYVIARYVVGGTPVQGFPFLASIIAIFSGAQLFALGVIGEYLGRVHFRMMDRPVYTIAERTVDDGEVVVVGEAVAHE